MRKVAPDIYQLDGFPPNMVNIYLVGDVLIDTGTHADDNRILRQLEGHTLRTVRRWWITSPRCENKKSPPGWR